MKLRPLLATAGKALLVMIAGFLIWGSCVALLRQIPASPDGAMRGVWNQIARGDTAHLPPRRLLDTYRHQLQADYYVVPALSGLLLGLLAAATGWLRRRDQLTGGLLYGAVMLSVTGLDFLFGWGAAALFTAALVAGASLRQRRPAGASNRA